ncbi:hypothetical protein Nepgr_002823 [Nepenthes gracilis]|uniref:Uncharacterized protein n=1 Tax=Nepenthes gracilis TaxID=150966 RepID=A0AAD3PA34_NEPGR|nr:hypothetical protein Nepgr_002823 [Nepenthes gracilis]
MQVMVPKSTAFGTAGALNLYPLQHHEQHLQQSKVDWKTRADNQPIHHKSLFSKERDISIIHPDTLKHQLRKKSIGFWNGYLSPSSVNPGGSYTPSQHSTSKSS